MISKSDLEALAGRYQVSSHPNVLREYFQHIFLSHLYDIPDAKCLLFKGGTALRIVYGSPRFSEDLDFSFPSSRTHNLTQIVDHSFVQVLTEIERMGARVEIGQKTGATTGGYFGIATFRLPEYPAVDVAINVSSRKKREGGGEMDSIASDFAPTYNIIHLPQEELVEEKIFGALATRKKPRDFYDLYFIMRKGMLTPPQKKRLRVMKDQIIAHAKKINFRLELSGFLPSGHQALIRDFTRTLTAELNRQLF